MSACAAQYVSMMMAAAPALEVVDEPVDRNDRVREHEDHCADCGEPRPSAARLCPGGGTPRHDQAHDHIACDRCEHVTEVWNHEATHHRSKEQQGDDLQGCNVASRHRECGRVQQVADEEADEARDEVTGLEEHVAQQPKAQTREECGMRAARQVE
eukprot:CAMPEP_0205941216 /NCGR_PEP_ID=MMETSP1325-20131115/54345_1 /ASSEMBLY_ACC=CAM_ASM_000708 /TAXON_ID=236786 /ORGANISM="Florenciella sp., Strain RCC1007" /LENGTH=155 /DNA_ID=CAMNT_0053311835 /DNA_START=72 /DNA_END=538 /DNA_ORIENTATION=-